MKAGRARYAQAEFGFGIAADAPAEGPSGPGEASRSAAEGPGPRRPARGEALEVLAELKREVEELQRLLERE